MQKFSPCAICETNFAKYRCKICGRMVCEDHYSRAADICTECKIGRI